MTCVLCKKSSTTELFSSTCNGKVCLDCAAAIWHWYSDRVIAHGVAARMRETAAMLRERALRLLNRAELLEERNDGHTD